MRASARRRTMQSCPAMPAVTVQKPHWRHAMKWETPAACDFRFGFEITMYIANR